MDDTLGSLYELWTTPNDADLTTRGDAWHWIDPDPGIAKAARVLRAGGTITWFWSSYEVDESVATAFDAAYSVHAPEVAQVWSPQRTPVPNATRWRTATRSPRWRSGNTSGNAP